MSTKGAWSTPTTSGFNPGSVFPGSHSVTPHTVIRGGYGIYNDVKVINERNFSLGTELGWQQIVDAGDLLSVSPLP